MEKKIIYWVLFFALFVTACSSDDGGPSLPSDEEIPQESAQMLNVAYGTEERQVYDIYLPAQRSYDETKVILLVHGGGWVSGDKSDLTDLISSLQLSYGNYAFVNMNYRYATNENPVIPNQLDDLESVIEHVSSRFQEYHIRNDAFVLMGFSAGAHLITHYGFSRDASNLLAVCNFVGPVDFNDPYYALSGIFVGDENAMVHTTDVPEGWTPQDYASPVNHIAANSISLPVLGVFGSEDPLVPESQRNSLEQTLTDASVPHETHMITAGHNLLETQENQVIVGQILQNFMTQYVSGQ